MVMKTLTFGMATGIYSNIESMDNFLSSFRKYSDGAVCIVTDSDDEDFVNFMKRFDVDVFRLKNKITPESVMYMRWILPHKIINEQYLNKVDYVLLTDTRDVVFQNDPFQFFDSAGLDLSVETKKIKDCPHFNARWMNEIYGGDSYELTKDNWILCAGVTGGGTKYALQLCELMINEHKRLGDRFVDQAYLNLCKAENKLPPFKLHFTGDKAVATIGHSWGSTTLREDGMVVNNDVIPAIVHQYDRHSHSISLITKQAH